MTEAAAKDVVEAAAKNEVETAAQDEVEAAGQDEVEAGAKDVVQGIDSGPTQADPDWQAVAENHDSNETTSLELGSLSESSMSTTVDDGSKQDQSPPITWKEPIRGRKIHTTSLLLRRKKKIKRRNKQKPVLRLRGGCGDGEEKDDDGMKSSDEDDDYSGLRSKQDKRKTREPSATLEEEASSRVGNFADGKTEVTHEAEINTEVMIEPNLDKAAMGDAGGGKEAMMETEDETHRQSVLSLDRPSLWTDWELRQRRLRPMPLDPARQPDLAYMNMTVDEAENEDGVEHYDLSKDAYRRSDAQVQVVK